MSGRREYDQPPSSGAAVAEPDPDPEGEAPQAVVSRRRPRLRSLALNGLFVLACIYTLRLAREFFLPLALGLVLYFVLLPAVRALRRLHIPAPVGAGLILRALMVSLALGTYALS